MSVVDAVGWVAALSSALLAVPQGTRIAMTRSVAGVSTLAWQTMFIAGLAWTSHGLLTGTPQILWPNMLLAITSAWVLRQLQVAHRLPLLRTWLPPVAVAALAFSADFWWGPVAFAVVALIPGLIGQSAQWREIVRTDNPAGVSMVGLLAQFGCQALWFAYALPAREIAVLGVCTPIGVIIAGCVVALHLRRRRVAALVESGQADAADAVAHGEAVGQ